jgi:predicted glycogen debranching enzyme
MKDLFRRISWRELSSNEASYLLNHEWMVTNGLGGYASGTVSGVVTRRFHGLLIAALPSPFGRTMMLNYLTESIRLPDGTVVQLSGEEKTGGVLELHGDSHLTEFRLELGLPVWRYEVGKVVLEKRIILPHMQNTVYVNYQILSENDHVGLILEPRVCIRPHEGRVSDPLSESYVLNVHENNYELNSGPDLPYLRMTTYGDQTTFTNQTRTINDVFYRIEHQRGYDYVGNLWSPGYFTIELSNSQSATFLASTEMWEVIRALSPQEALEAEIERRSELINMAHPKAQSEVGAELVLAADQFIITPAGRIADAARAHAAGDEVRTVIAGYHWFTDWGRDTMISLEGLTLTTGRHIEASWILRTFAHYIRDGLIPNMFPEGHKEGLYHTADATLWFFQAIHRYLEVTGDKLILKIILPKLIDIIDHHVRGTRFGIKVDQRDGLLRQGQEGYQLTWMDAKVDDWVVTPRRGKAVEINALWYNALCLVKAWVEEEFGADKAQPYMEHAEKARQSFNERFWYAKGGYLYDVVDGEKGDDPACRPNQLLAISLQHPILNQERWEAVVKTVHDKLLTPVGLRSLSSDHPDYKATYDGDLRARDAAYHQGTVWSWLIGPFIDAWIKVYPNERQASRRFLEGLRAHLSDGCIGSVSEIFDAEAPYKSRGCVAQAWGVAELLRCWVNTRHL